MNNMFHDWHPFKKVEVLMSIIKGQLTVKDVLKSYKLNRHVIHHWLNELTDNQKIFPQFYSIMWKDDDLKFRDCNQQAGEYGSHKRIKECIGQTADKSSPEKAEFIHMMNEKVLNENISIKCHTEMTTPILGKVPAIGYINPIRNDFNEPVGLFIYHYPHFNFKNLPFRVIYQAIISGQSILLLNKPEYELFRNNNKIILNVKEMEIFLYLLIGKSSKSISNHMNMSSKTVENMIMHMKTKIGLDKTEYMINFIWDNV